MKSRTKIYVSPKIQPGFAGTSVALHRRDARGGGGIAIMRTMKIERAEITLSTDIVIGATAFLFTLFLLVGFAIVFGA
jgi:hypothetical protein